MKILIVEDNQPFREEMIRLIKKEEDEIYQCDDGIYVESLYEAIKPDVVLMDIKMKEMSGLEASKNLNEKHPEAKIIIVTNFNEEKIRQAALQNGAKAFLPKENLTQLNQLLKDLEI